ncbi:uncharacterized protein LOC143228495 [Tachypleus tridentatus]|uniref:uncharacterized protein LOC143228495 n=1 Tax=Tachypleus tridentatus TaxID=6853 RepID=UPI003FCFCCCC
MVYIFHTYKRRWRTVDLFLLAVGTQELVTALYAFGFAVLNLFSPRAGPACSFILWGLTATRTFQIFTLASLVVDRALTIRWPYKYRFTVRRNQIIYHITVTAIIAVIVGVAAVFARSPHKHQEYHCSVHPLGWDYRFSLFNICLHSILMITVLVCCFDLEVNHCQARHRRLHFSDPLTGTENSTGTTTSSSVTSSSSESTRPLHSPSRQESRRPYSTEQTSSDIRRTTVEAVSCLCYLVNHLPFLVLNILAMLTPPFWSSWHENIILWLRLVEGLAIPLLFYFTDPQHRSALRHAFQRRSGKFSDFGDDRHYPLYLEDIIEGNTKPSPFESVTPIGIITNYRRSPGKKNKSQHSNAQKKSLWRTGTKKRILPSIYGVDTVLNPSHLTNNLQTVVHIKPQPEKDDVTKLSSIQIDSWKDTDTHIYATLSDNLSSLSYQSSLPDDNVFSRGGAEAEEEMYGGSLTTIANADFEFHYAYLGDVRSGDVLYKYDSEMELSGSEDKVWKYPDNSSDKSSNSEIVQDLVIRIDSAKDFCHVKGSPETEKAVQKTRHQSNDNIPFHVYRVRTEELCKMFHPPLQTVGSL